MDKVMENFLFYFISEVYITKPRRPKKRNDKKRKRIHEKMKDKKKGALKKIGRAHV